MFNKAVFKLEVILFFLNCLPHHKHVTVGSLSRGT